MPTRLRYPDPVLSDDLVRLRRWELDDVGCIEEASSDPRIPEGTTVPVAYSDDEGRAFIERHWSRVHSREGLSLAIATVEHDRAVGLVVLTHRPQPGTVGIGYWVVAHSRQRRCASRAVRLITDWALTDAGVDRLEAWVEPENLASQRVLEATNFELEGGLRSFLVFPTRRADALVYSRIARPPPPGPPTRPGA